jgi:hypothetical protein
MCSILTNRNKKRHCQICVGRGLQIRHPATQKVMFNSSNIEILLVCEVRVSSSAQLNSSELMNLFELSSSANVADKLKDDMARQT